jgi:hypothetical protein
MPPCVSRGIFTRPLIAVLATVASGGSIIRAQTGQLDQSGPMIEIGPNAAQFNVDTDSLIWQQQIRVGVAGALEGVRLRFFGNVGASVAVRIRLGSAWADGPALVDIIAIKAVAEFESIFIDMSATGITLGAGDTFVLETQGTNSGVALIGSFVDPPDGDPLYPEPLFLGSGAYRAGWRHGFETYMLTDSEPCPGDLDGDGAVGLQDLAFLLANFGRTEGADPEDGDLDGDGDVELQDLAILLSHFGQTCP